MARNIRWFWVGAIGLAAAAGCQDPESVVLGATIPHHWTTQAEEVTDGAATPLNVWWVLSTRDCLDCETVEHQLRKLHYDNPSVNVQVVHVGERADTAILGSFLKKNRLETVPVVRLSPSAYRKAEAGYWDVPLLMIARNDSVVWFQPPNDFTPVPNISFPAAIDSLVALLPHAADERSLLR